MRAQILLGLVIVGFFAYCKAQDAANLLMDRRYVENQINCMLDRAPCDLLGKRIKALLPEVVNNNCRRCSPHQVRNAQKLVGFMRQHYPKEWRLIVQKYTQYYAH